MSQHSCQAGHQWISTVTQTLHVIQVYTHIVNSRINYEHKILIAQCTMHLTSLTYSLFFTSQSLEAWLWKCDGPWQLCETRVHYVEVTYELKALNSCELFNT